MDWFVQKYLQACLVWFGVGVTLGLAMAVWPMLTMYRVAHMHLLLLGFVAQIIYGVALHVIPRFFGQPLVLREFGYWQWWASQLGVLVLVGGLAGRIHGWTLAEPLMMAGGLLSAAAAYLFIANLWATMRRAKVNILPRNSAGSAGLAATAPITRQPKLPLMPQPD
jgi:heme/copper-type cytochrome/quinol oxidase subunit 1